MKNRKLGILLLTVFLLGLLTACGSGKEIRFGTAGTGGTYYAYGSALSSLLEDNLSGVKFDVKATAGSAANLRLLSEDYLQMAIAQADVIADAAAGEGSFEGKALSGYGAVAGLYTEACQIVVRADSGIKRIEDLEGKRVSVGEEESGVMKNAEQILLVYGLTPELLEAENLSYSDAAEALANGEIDAFFCTAGAPTNAVANAARQTEVRLLGLDAEKQKRLLNTYDTYVPCVIPAGTYEGQTEAVETVGVRAVLLASNRLNAQQVHDITEQLFQDAGKLQMATAADTPLTLEAAVENVPIGYHAGAAAYYGENDIQVGQEK